jgi:V/A-type H+-transporting ATPase subunit E
MADPDVTPSGVQALIDRIRDEGVQSALEEAAKILTEAKAQAARTVSDAKAEAAAMKKEAQAAIETERTAAIEALRMAARDTELELRNAVLAAFEEHVRRLVTDVTAEGSVLRDMILVLTGRAAEELIKDRDATVLVPERLLDEASPELEEFLRRSALAISGDVLRKGIQLIPSSTVRGGARVRLVDDDLEIDLSDEALSEMMLTLLLPRYRRILAEAGQ